jgi:hypothetical protein
MTFDIDFIITSPEYLSIQDELFDEGYTIFHKCDAFVQLRNGRNGLRERENKDFQDILQLIKSCKLDVKSNDIIKLFKKYDQWKLYERLINQKQS